MRNTNEKTVTVKREDLLLKLKENKVTHEKEYAELQEAYLDACEAKVTALLHATKKRDMELSSEYWQRPSKPSSHIEDYEVAIAMFEMEVNDEVVITQSEFKQYVLDQWDWARAFVAAKTTYNLH